MDYSLSIQNDERIWSFKGIEIHRKNFVTKSTFSLLDCELSWLYLTNSINNDKQCAIINDMPLNVRGSRSTSSSSSEDCHKENRKINLYFSDLDESIVKNILSTKLPRNFYLCKYCFDIQKGISRIAYSYKDIFKFLDYGDFKVKFNSSNIIIWGIPDPIRIVDNKPDNTITLFNTKMNDGLHFHWVNKAFFPFYRGNSEFVNCLTLGLQC